MENQGNKKLVSLMLSTMRLVRERTTAHGKVDPFSIAQFRVLTYVDEKQNPTMKDIAAFLYITSPSATAIVNRLVNLGEVERAYDSDDRRMVRLMITDKGKSTLIRLRDQSFLKMNKILEHLDEKDKQDLARILTKIIESK